VRVTPIHYEEVQGWIQPELPYATDRHDQIIQMYPEDNQVALFLG